MTLTKKDFEEAIKWTEDIMRDNNLGITSSIWPITNHQEEILEALNLKESIEKLIETQGEIYLPAVQLLLQSLLDKAKEDARK